MAKQSGWNPLIGVGFTALGVGYLWEAYKHNKGEDGDAVNGLGAVGKGRGVPNGIKTMKLYPAGDIAQREDYILNQIRKDSEDPRVISEARAILSGRCPAARGGKIDWCVQPKDFRGEVSALYSALTDPNSALAVRYTRDHATVDLFGSSGLMRRLPAEDCDGMAIRLGAWLRAVGHRVRTRVVAPASAPGQWSHIYLTTAAPGSDKFYPVDPTEPEKTRAHGRFPFWEPANDVAHHKKRDREA